MSFYSLNFFSWCNFYNLFFILKKISVLSEDGLLFASDM